jgi:hypothetical protein
MNPSEVQQTLLVLDGLPDHDFFSNRSIKIVVTTQDTVTAFGASIHQIYQHQKNPTYVTKLLISISDLYAHISHKSMRDKFVLESWAAKFHHQLAAINKFVSSCEAKNRSHRWRKQYKERKEAKKHAFEIELLTRSVVFFRAQDAETPTSS